LACHSDQALRLLAQTDRAEQSILVRFGYADNDVVLHPYRCPRRKLAVGSWNMAGTALPAACSDLQT